MEYRLNGKRLSKYRYLMEFQGMTSFMDRTVSENKKRGDLCSVFSTHIGQLVIIHNKKEL